MGMTYTDLANARGVGIDAVRLARAARIKKGFVFSGPFGKDAELSEADLRALEYVGRGRRKGPTEEKARVPRAVATAPLPAAALPVPEKKVRNWEELAVVAGSTVVTVASVLLTNFELTSLAGHFGLALGVGFAAYLFLTVVVARNRMKGNTSARALKTLLHCEILAGVLHAFNFNRQLAEEIPNQWACLLAAVLLAVFMVFISYESVLALRNFNAEVAEEGAENTLNQ